MGFAYRPHGISIQFPSIPQIFHIFDMHDLKACQIFYSSHLWNIGIWHWHMCSHGTLISVCHTFHILRELPYCFNFQTAYCCFLNGRNSTAKAQTNITADISDSINISGWKVSRDLFFKHWRNCTVKVCCNVITSNNRIEVNQLFIKDGTEFPFIQGLPYLYTIHNHSITTHTPINVWV